MEEIICIRKFDEIDIKDPFFDSLIEDYPRFSEWFERKGLRGADAYVQYKEDGTLQAFLYMKDESNEALTDVIPNRIACKRLKVGTFKIDAHNTKLGERFVKKFWTKESLRIMMRYT